MTEKMTKLDEQIAKVNEKIEKLTKQKKSLLSKQSEEKRKNRILLSLYCKCKVKDNLYLTKSMC